MKVTLSGLIILALGAAAVAAGDAKRGAQLFGQCMTCTPIDTLMGVAESGLTRSSSSLNRWVRGSHEAEAECCLKFALRDFLRHDHGVLQHALLDLGI